MIEVKNIEEATWICEDPDTLSELQTEHGINFLIKGKWSIDGAEPTDFTYAVGENDNAPMNLHFLEMYKNGKLKLKFLHKQEHIPPTVEQIHQQIVSVVDVRLKELYNPRMQLRAERDSDFAQRRRHMIDRLVQIESDVSGNFTVDDIPDVEDIA